MLAFVFFIAVLNLGVGYILGGGELPGFLTKIPFLNRKPKPEEFNVEESLTKPVTVEPSIPVPEAVPIPQLQIPEEVAQVFDEPEEEVELPFVEGSLEAADESKLDHKQLPSTDELLAGLSSLQVKLAAASEQLNDQQDNPDEFEECASKLQEANHNYLKNAHGTVSQLTKLSENGNQDASKIGDLVSKGAEDAQQISDKIDTLLDSPLDADGRKQLLEHSSNITAAVSKSHDEADEIIHATSKAVGEKTNAETSAKELINLIENAVNSISDNNSLFLAEAKLDPLSETATSPKFMDTITDDLSDMISNVLDRSQSYTCEGRRLMFLNGDSLDQAINRVEQLRQCYEKTIYKDESESVTGTLTCTISEIKKGTNTSEIDAILEKSAIEADSLGTNQTLHHDGAFATPVEPVTHDFSPRVVEVN